MIDLKNKIALVTGSSRGIGKAIALRLAYAGAFVIGTATEDARAQQITSYLEEAGYNGVGKTLDVTNGEKVDSFINELIESEKAPHILVNNAGITCDNLLLRMEDEEWYKVIETNLNSIFRMSRACLKPMFRSRWEGLLI